MADVFDAFRSAEYQSIRIEILSHIDAIKSIENETFIGVGAVIAWLLAYQADKPLGIRIAGAVILIIFVFGNMARVRDRQRRINRLGSYSKAVERVFAAQHIDVEHAEMLFDVKGYEHFHAEVNSRRRGYNLFKNISVPAEGSEDDAPWNELKTKHQKTRLDEARGLIKIPISTEVIVESYHQALWPILMLLTLLIGFVLICWPGIVS